MLRLERNEDFWLRIVSHPDVSPGLFLSPHEFMTCVTNDNVFPMASKNGGFLYVKTDSAGLTAEFHTVFTPEGRGREAFLAAIEFADYVFDTGLQLLMTYEVESNPKSSPPLSFGFKSHGDYSETTYGRFKLWSLDKDSWRNAPVNKRRS